MRCTRLFFCRHQRRGRWGCDTEATQRLAIESPPRQCSRTHSEHLNICIYIYMYMHMPVVDTVEACTLSEILWIIDADVRIALRCQHHIIIPKGHNQHASRVDERFQIYIKKVHNFWTIFFTAVTGINVPNASHSSLPCWCSYAKAKRRSSPTKPAASPWFLRA